MFLLGKDKFLAQIKQLNCHLCPVTGLLLQNIATPGCVQGAFDVEHEYLYPLRLRWWQPSSHSPQVAWLLIKLPLIHRESLLELPAVALKCLSYPCGCHVNQKIP